MPRSSGRVAALPAILLAGATLAGSGTALPAQPTAAGAEAAALRTVDVQPSAPPPAAEARPPAQTEAPQPAAPAAAAAAADGAPQEDPTQRITIRRGDTLAGRLAAAGIDAEDAHDAVAAIATHVPPRHLQPGQQLTLRADPADPGSLLALALAVEPGRTVRARRTRSGAWQVEEERAEARRHLVRIEGGVRGGLFDSLRAAGLPPPLALELVRALARIVDLQRELSDLAAMASGRSSFRPSCAARPTSASSASGCAAAASRSAAPAPASSSIPPASSSPTTTSSATPRASPSRCRTAPNSRPASSARTT